MDFDSEALLRRLNELAMEAEQKVTAPPGRTWSQFFGGMSPLHRQKSPERALADARQDYVLSRLSDETGRAAYQGMLPEAPGMAQALRGYRGQGGAQHLNRESLRSPNEYVGFLGPGSALDKFGTWTQAGAGAAMAASDMLANAANDATVLAMTGTLDHPARGGYRRGYGEAGNALLRHIGTMAPQDLLGSSHPARAAHASGSQPRSAWEAKDAARQAGDDQINWRNLTYDDRARSEGLEQEAQASNVEEMSPWLQEYNVPQGFAAPVGFLGDNILNPLPPPLKAISAAARAGQTARAGRMIAGELAPTGALAGAAYGLGPAMEYMQRQGVLPASTPPEAPSSYDINAYLEMKYALDPEALRREMAMRQGNGR